ncbi:carboxylesterase/lipase family protein [Rhodococcus koreensis]
MRQLSEFLVGRRAFIAGSAALLASAPWGSSSSEADEVIDTTSGKMRGYRERSICVFKGIPYGEPVSGGGRFLPPAPFKPRPGVFDATQYGPVCPQLSKTSQAQSEDCLVLNIWTPGCERDRKRPVMVQIHGGGFRTGSGAIRSGEGLDMALAQDVVVVNINHRLGPLGYLYLGDVLGGEYGTGNAGNLDLVLALRWIRDNIAEFGGDPSCVTVFGVSGGGKKISHLLAMPSAHGLFHRAVVMSGALSTAIERPSASAYTERVLAKLGLDETNAASLVNTSVEALLRAVAELTAAGQDPEGGYGGGGGPQPLVDGHSLPGHPGDLVASGSSAHVPVMIGSTLDEPIAGYQGSEGLQKLETMNETQIRARLADGPFVRLGDRTDEVIAHYRTVWPDISPGALMVRIETAGSWRHLVNVLADRKASAHAAPTWVYVMTYAGGTPNGPRGASHSTDIPLVMGNPEYATDVSPTPWFAESVNVAEMSRIMSDTWCSFARTGVPDSKLLPSWPAYTQDKRETMLLDLEPSVVLDPFKDSSVFPGVAL